MKNYIYSMIKNEINYLLLILFFQVNLHLCQINIKIEIYYNKKFETIFLTVPT